MGNRTRAYERSEKNSIMSSEFPAGNLTKDDARYYYWDYGNRLTRVTDQEGTPNVLADFRYDALGRLIEKVASGLTTRYYLDGVRIVEETEDGPSLKVGKAHAEKQYYVPRFSRARLGGAMVLPCRSLIGMGHTDGLRRHRGIP